MEKNGWEKCIHAGLLVLRIGIGLFFLGHGVPKLLGGPETWEGLGQAMGVIGITFLPVFWGFMAAISEAIGGLFLILGCLVRPAAALMLVTMLVAIAMHASKGDGFNVISHPGEMAVVFLALLIAGGGRYTLCRLWGKCPCKGEANTACSASANSGSSSEDAKAVAK